MLEEAAGTLEEAADTLEEASTLELLDMLGIPEKEFGSLGEGHHFAFLSTSYCLFESIKPPRPLLGGFFQDVSTVSCLHS